MNDLSENTEKKQNSRFEKGISGNPNGRPRGSRNKTTLAAYSLFKDEAEAITKEAIEAAKGGDITAIRLCLDRIAPPIKHAPIPAVDLPPLQSLSDLPAFYASLNTLLGDGALSIEELNSLVSMADKFRQSVDLAELELRIEALELNKTN